MRRRSRTNRTGKTMLATAGFACAAGAAWWFWPNGGKNALANGSPRDDGLHAAAGIVDDRRGAGADIAAGTVSEAPVSGQEAAAPSDADGFSPQAQPGAIDEVLDPRGAVPTGASEAEPLLPSMETDAGAALAAAAEPQPAPATAAPEEDAPVSSDNPAIRDAIARFERGEAIPARQELNRLLGTSLTERDHNAVRQALRRIADETVFSGRANASDPLLDVYVVKSGDNPNAIAARYKLPGEGVMLLNNIRDPSKLRLDQKLVVPREAFHARISKSKLRLDLYLGDTYVRSYPVGLGGAATPEGGWRVKNRLANPTYYPPASASEKRIIPPHDPRNPLGERWIGLEGASGQAVGSDGYGIHGTSDPDSIGKNVSLGCVRMHNADVRFVYALLSPGDSTVTIAP